MRRTLLACALTALALALPAAGTAARRGDAATAADGTVVIKNATGTIWIRARGAIIGRADEIVKMTVNDPIAGDGATPVVLGADDTEKLTKTKSLYVGTDVRFKLLGGYSLVKIVGTGISLSVVGSGKITMDGGLGGSRRNGSYSIDDAPFQALPDSFTTFAFGD